MDFTAKPDSGKEGASVPEVQYGAQRVVDVTLYTINKANPKTPAPSQPLNRTFTSSSKPEKKLSASAGCACRMGAMPSSAVGRGRTKRHKQHLPRYSRRRA